MTRKIRFSGINPVELLYADAVFKEFENTQVVA
jgi:hypothetical protein